MEEKTIFVKNMVCNRCVMVVHNELLKLGFELKKVTLGEVVFEREVTYAMRHEIKKVLHPLGFEVIEDRKGRIIEQIKTFIIKLVHERDGVLKVNLSDELRSELNYDYNYLSKLFSDVEGTTIEKFYIAHKVERVKELLVYDELTLSEIADRMNYSSVAYLSNQFKKVTGLTPGHFKRISSDKRKPLDKV